MNDLLAQLKSQTVRNRSRAAWAPGKIGPAAAPARDALKACLGDNHPAVRQSAGRSLKQINAIPVGPDD